MFGILYHTILLFQALKAARLAVSGGDVNSARQILEEQKIDLMFV